MNRFMNHRARRSTAWLMLCVWMFALASGIANACALEVRGSHSHAMAGGDHPGVASSAHAAEDAGADSHHDGDSHDSKAPCLKACDEGSLSLLKHSVVPDLTDPGAAFVVAFAWAVSVPVLSARSRAHHLRPLSSGPPLRVRYVRLAL
jgi:hypothetical protein